MHNFTDPLVQACADFYVLAIGAGEPVAAVEQFVGDRYVQHNLHVADGKNGFIENFNGFTDRVPDRDIQVLRGFRDDEFVFIHVLQDLGAAGLWVTMDIFLIEEGKIVEHWDNIEKAATPEAATQMLGGSTEIIDLAQTHANKAAVYQHLHWGTIGRDLSVLEQYVDKDEYRHHLGARGGNWADRKQLLFPASGIPEVRYEKIHRLIGSGNFVASQVEGTFKGQPAAFLDLFRLDNGKIVEQWNVTEGIPPKEKWAHENGKF